MLPLETALPLVAVLSGERPSVLKLRYAHNQGIDSLFFMIEFL